MRSRAILVLALVVGPTLLPTGASAVWGGQVDTAHPQVGAMYHDFLHTGNPIIGGLVCSGSYAGESKDGQHEVFLTAGHCSGTAAARGIPASDIYVSFDSNASSTSVQDAVSNPIQVQAYYQMSEWGHDFGDYRDLGVLLLPKDSVPRSLVPVQLPPAGYLDSLKAARTLEFRVVDIVGYGLTPVWDPTGPTSFVFDGKRRVGTTTVTGLTKAFVFYNQNPNGVGTGSGLCEGDSGSPQFDHGSLLVLSITTRGNSQCNSVNYNYRVDTPQAREFLSQFLVLP